MSEEEILDQVRVLCLEFDLKARKSPCGLQDEDYARIARSVSLTGAYTGKTKTGVHLSIRQVRIRQGLPTEATQLKCVFRRS